MAEVQDLDVEYQEEKGELETVEQQVNAEKQVEEAKKNESLLPPEYRGKSVEDVMKMHQEAQKLIGRQSQEVAEVRRLADELIKSQLQKKPEVEQPKEVDFFENPQEAIRRQIESNPRVLQAEQFAIQAQRANAQQALAQRHPDYSQIASSGDFAEWIRSSKVRTELFQRAQAYDFDSANELLSTFKELKAVKMKEVQSVASDADKTARAKTLQTAEVDTGGSGETTKKIYRRADLIRLNMRDPAKYAEMADEIMAAYREGRVK